MWLSEFKKALILKELDKLDTLTSNMPQFETIDEMEEAFYLLNQSLILAESEKSAALIALQQIKTTLEFLKSTEATLPSSLNLKF